jgi:hypothetical protein
MDILTLELLDVTVFQALLELRAQLAEHPGEALLIRGEDEMLRVNVAGYLEKQGRGVRQTQQGSQWELVVAAVLKPSVPPVTVAPQAALRPVLLLRSAFAPGDRALGRRLLLETLAQLEPGTPWLCLAHQAVELLEDPGAVAVLEGLRERGIPVRVSKTSLAHARQEDEGFDPVQDEDWQRLLARGLLTVL